MQRIDIWKNERNIGNEELRRLMESNQEVGIIVTDDIAVYQLACEMGIAVLPVPETMDDIDAFPGAKYLVIGKEHVDASVAERIYQRFHHIPWNILETERVLVREQTVADVDALYEIYKDPSITEYTDALYEDPDEERAYASQYIHNMYELHEHGIWILEDKKKPGTMIGRAGLELRGGFDTPELGYVIRKEYQRQGYAYEVCKAILQYGKEELAFDEVRILTEEENIASLALCKKLGFQYDSEQMIHGSRMKQYIYRDTGAKEI